MVISGSVERHIPNALTLFGTHFKSFSGKSVSSLLLLAPIHSTSAFFLLLFRLRPEIALKSSNICREDVKDSFELSKMRVVSSAH